MLGTELEENEEIIRQISFLGPAIATKISIFSKRASVVDAKFREDVLMRVVSVHDAFAALFRNGSSDNSTGDAQLRPMEEAINSLLRFVSVAQPLLLYIRVLSNPHIQDVYATCRKVFSRQRASILYVLQHNLVTPILSTQDSWFSVMNDLVAETGSPDLRKFQSMLAWAAVAWEGMVNVGEKTTVGADEPVVDFEHLLRLEHDLTLNQLSSDLENPLNVLIQAQMECAKRDEAGQLRVTELELSLKRIHNQMRYSRQASDVVPEQNHGQDRQGNAGHDVGELAATGSGVAGPDREELASRAKAEELHTAKEALEEQRHRASKQILENMATVAATFDASKGWKHTQNAEQLLVVKEIQHVLCAWNSLDDSARSNLVGPAEDLEHAAACPFTAALREASSGALNSPLMQIPLYLAVSGGGQKPHFPGLNISTAEIFHVRVTSTPETVVLDPGQVKVMFLVDHLAALPVTAVLLHCTENIGMPGQIVKGLLHITGRHSCDRQKLFFNKLGESLAQDLGISVVQTDEVLLDDTRSTGIASLNENVFRILCSLVACRLRHERDLPGGESAACCNFHHEYVAEDEAALRHGISTRLRVVRSMPARHSVGYNHDVMQMFQSALDEIQLGLDTVTNGPPGQNVKALQRLQIHIQQQSFKDRQTVLHGFVERVVPKSPFERARLADLLESSAQAFQNVWKPLWKVIGSEPCAQTIVNRSHAAVKLLKNTQRLLTFVAKFQTAKIHASSIAEITDMHSAVGPLSSCFKYNIVSPVIRAVVKEDNNVIIANDISQGYFAEKQKQLDELLQRLGVPSETLQKFGLSTIFVDVGNLLPAVSGHGGESGRVDRGTTQRGGNDASDKLISDLYKHIKHARNLGSPPRHLIAAFEKHLEELAAYNASSLAISNEDFKRRKVAVDKLGRKLLEYVESLTAEDPVLSQLPKELLALKTQCELIPEDVRILTGAAHQERVQPYNGGGSPEMGDPARIAFEMNAERSGILKLVRLIPSTRDADARRILHRQAVTLMLPVLGSQDIEPHLLRRDVILYSAAKRAQSLVSEPAASLLGSMSVLQEHFQVRRPKGSDLTEDLHKAALSDVIGMVSDLHAKRENLLNAVNSFGGETPLRVCPVSLSIADVFSLTAIACPVIIDYCLRLQVAADRMLNKSFSSGTYDAFPDALPYLPTELTDGEPDLVVKPDLGMVSLVDGGNKAELSETLITAATTIRKVVEGIIGGGATNTLSLATGSSKSAEVRSNDACLHPSGIVSATDEWVPLQLFLCCILIELCRSIAEQSMTSEHLEDMLRKNMAKDPTLTAALKEERGRVKEQIAELQVLKDRTKQQKTDLCSNTNGGSAGSATIRTVLRTREREVERLGETIAESKEAVSALKQKLEHSVEAQVRHNGEKLHVGLKKIFSERPCGSNANAMSAEGLYEHIVALPSHSRESFFNDFRKRADDSLQDIARVRRMLESMIDRNTAAEERYVSQVLHLLDVCGLAMSGMKNTAGCLHQYLTTVETSGGRLRDFVAQTTPNLEHVFFGAEQVFLEAKKDCSDFDCLSRLTFEVLGRLEDLRDKEMGLFKQRGGDHLGCDAAMRSISALIKTACIFCTRAVFVNLSNVRARQLHSDRLDQCFKVCRENVVLLEDYYLLALKDHELVVELDFLRHQRFAVKAGLRGVILHAAFGVASSPFELACLLQEAIGTVDVQALAPAFATKLLVQDWLEPMGACTAAATSHNTPEAKGTAPNAAAAATLDKLKNELARIPHSHVLKKDAANIGNSASARASLVQGVSGRVGAVASAVNFLDGEFMACGVGLVHGLLRSFPGEPSPEQARAARNLTTVFQEVVRVLIRQLLLMCSSSVCQQVAISVAGLTPLKVRLLEANTTVMLVDRGDPDSPPKLNGTLLLLVDCLRVDQRRHGDGDVTHLDTLQLEIWSEAQSFHGAASDAKTSELLAIAENLSDLLFVGTTDMCGPLQLLLKSTLDISTCCDMIDLYYRHALRCIEALYSPLEHVMEDDGRRSNESRALLHDLFKAEDTFVESIVQALRLKALVLLPRRGMGEALESNHYGDAQRHAVHATELADKLLVAGTDLLNLKYAIKRAEFNKNLSRVERKYDEWLATKTREDALFEKQVEKRLRIIEDAERRVRSLLSPSRTTTGQEGPDKPHDSIVRLQKKDWRSPTAGTLLKRVIDDHYCLTSSDVVLRLECPRLTGRNFFLDKVNVRIGEDEEKTVIHGIDHDSQTLWEVTIPLSLLDPQNDTQVYVIQHWTERFGLHAVVRKRKRAIYRTDVRLSRNRLEAEIEPLLMRTRIDFSHRKGEDFDQGPIRATYFVVETMKSWAPKSSLEVTKSCSSLWKDIEQALSSITRAPTRKLVRQKPETPQLFRSKYEVQMAMEREAEGRTQGGPPGDYLRDVKQQVAFWMGDLDERVERLARRLDPSTSDGGENSSRLEHEAGRNERLKLCFELVASCDKAIDSVSPLYRDVTDDTAPIVGDTLTPIELNQPAHALSTSEMQKLRKGLVKTLKTFCIAMQSTGCIQWGDVMLLCVGIEAASVQGPAGIKVVLGELKKARAQQSRALKIWARQSKDPTLYASKVFHCANICDNIDQMLHRRQERMLLLHGAAKRAAEALGSKQPVGDFSAAFDSKQARSHGSTANIQVSACITRSRKFMP